MNLDNFPFERFGMLRNHKLIKAVLKFLSKNPNEKLIRQVLNVFYKLGRIDIIGLYSYKVVKNGVVFTYEAMFDDNGCYSLFLANVFQNKNELKRTRALDATRPIRPTKGIV